VKDAPDAILRGEQAAYLDTTLAARDPLLTEMEAYAAAHDHPISDPEVAALLSAVVAMRRPSLVVEVGTNIGYGAIVLGRAAPASARVVTVEKNPATADVARAFVARAGLAAKVEVVTDDALGFLAALAGPVDLAYLDCIKEDYPRYLELLGPKLSPGAVVLADNVLWKGLVAKPDAEVPDKELPRVAGLREFNRRITSAPYAGVILPIGDGVALATRS